jgi:hypothetical protein
MVQEASSTFAPRITLRKNAPPNADVIIVSTNRYGAPGGLKDEILIKIGLSPSAAPGADMLASGFAIIQRPEAKGLVGFVVTVGGGDPKTSLTRNLAACLDSREIRRARTIWMPLMATGAGGLSNEQSLEAILDALQSVDFAQGTEVKITIAPPPQIDRKSLLRLRSMLSGETTEEISTESKAPDYPNLDEELAAILAMADALGPGRVRNNSRVTTSLLLFALSEARNSHAPRLVSTNTAACAFADAIRKVADNGYRAAWKRYFRPDFNFHRSVRLSHNKVVSEYRKVDCIRPQ